MTDLAQLLPVYIDANPFIYAVEGGDALAGSITVLFGRLGAWRGIALLTSELS
jgi:hypothetical protein